MPDSQAIDTALVTKLSSDGELLSYMPNGVYFDEAPPNMTRFVIISLVEEADVPMFGARAMEDAQYLVKAVARTTVPTAAADIKAAAARIDALLENQPLTAVGYAHMVTQRESRIRLTEVDDLDDSIRWYQRGGQYRVVMST